jgi:hypothetical protein
VDHGRLFMKAGVTPVATGRAPAIPMMRECDSMELRACSACAGDYEDPDRTAGEEFEGLLSGYEIDDCWVDVDIDEVETD